MKSRTFTLCSTAFLGLAMVAIASADPVRVIVGFHGNVDAGVFAALGGKAATRLDSLGAVAGTIPSGKLNALRRTAGVSYVEEDLVREANLEPNDTYYNYYFGSSYENDGYNDQFDDFALINAQAAWDQSSGSGVTVAVLDTGYDTRHSDAGNVVASRNFTSRKANDVSDKDGHGTHTAGTVAAATNNNLGVAGTAPDASLAIGKVLGPQGGYDSWIAAGMTWAVDNAGAAIVSMSLGGTGTSSTLDNACAYVWGEGGTAIAAAGNSSVDAFNHYPSAHPTVVSVAAVDEDGNWASFSNYGGTVDLAAPG
ncbi:MAG: S8 family serine peptidase, partial [Akkermansiaceae bacterium]|nr:S8 family serine peptidase [Akkermansiaceae bacterium]